MSPATRAAAVMSLTDIASLAHVQRPVVSAWRHRPVARGQHTPFPEPISPDGDPERFDMEEVVDWLLRTGRGNNPDFRADALAHAQPRVRLDDAAVDAGLDALLCLKACSGVDLAELSADELVSAAEEVDPLDDHLVSELLDLADELSPVASYAQELTDAAWDPASAHEVVRRRRNRCAETDAALAPGMLTLVGRVGAAVALDLDSDIVIADPLLADPDLVEAVLAALGEAVTTSVLVVGDCPRARSTRRLHRIRGRNVLRSLLPGGRPLVITRVSADLGAKGAAKTLAMADDVQLDLTEDQRALVLGPASTLCDGLEDGALDRQRDHLIRLGRLRCALRLPPGLVTDGSRQALGVWVMGPESRRRRLQEPRIAVADLTNEALRADVVEDITTDVVASLSDHARATHAFRYARLSATAAILAGAGSIVPAGARPTRVTGTPSAEDVMRLQLQAADLDAERLLPPVLSGVTVAPAETSVSLGNVTIEAALHSGHLRVLAGTRISMDVPTAAGGVRVITADDVQDPKAPRRGLDPIELEAAWPRTRRTEPGDVIFCVSPRPAAIVDEEGLSVVASPARILRCAPGSGLVPHAVAHSINDLPERSPRWRAWRVPRVPAAQAEGLLIALRHLAAEEHRARQRQARLGALATELTRGLASGAMTLDTTSTTHPSPTEEGH